MFTVLETKKREALRQLATKPLGGLSLYEAKSENDDDGGSGLAFGLCLSMSRSRFLTRDNCDGNDKLVATWQLAMATAAAACCVSAAGKRGQRRHSESQRSRRYWLVAATSPHKIALSKCTHTNTHPQQHPTRPTTRTNTLSAHMPNASKTSHLHAVNTFFFLMSRSCVCVVIVSTRRRRRGRCE